MPDKPKSKRKKIFRKLKHTYRLVFFNDSNFEEVWHVRFTLINILSIIGTIFILLVGGSIALVMFTPMREMVPGYPTQEMRNRLVSNVLMLDSLEYEIHLRDRYFNTINAIISGKEPELTESLSDNTNPDYNNISFTRSEEDSLLRKHVEEEEQFNFVLQTSPYSEEESISKIHFFKPIEGLITSKFDLKNNHLGIDLVASPNQVVKATLDGTVIMAAWTVETGYVIQVQHAFNILSVYKHNASLLKKSGDVVKAGDAIAIIGNSGDLTTGPHLHFEMWQSGKPVNPEDFIVF
ncbi:MAG: M23 family metallopeptidase [Bacteroidales bacterium]|jgi:murein DD-endopeptidase MepM/ murein hydrolase activator NlpD|nr:M23 family metallopeptidase [Bacteroidales bacterium]